VNKEDTEEHTNALGQVFNGGVRLLAISLKEGRHKELGLTPEEYARRIVPTGIKLPPAERKEEAKQLTKPEVDGGMGLSQREAAAALGVKPSTVNADLKDVQNRTDDANPTGPDQPKPESPVQNRTDDDDVLEGEIIDTRTDSRDIARDAIQDAHDRELHPEPETINAIFAHATATLDKLRQAQPMPGMPNVQHFYSKVEFLKSIGWFD
jgi:hypothetical protein